MVIPAGLQADPSSDAETGIKSESLTTWRERSLRWQREDLDRALASFTFVADVTTLADDCCFSGDSHTLVARYDGLPFAAIAFSSEMSSAPAASLVPGRSIATMPAILRDRTTAGLSSIDEASKRLATLTRHLVQPDEAFVCLVGEEDWPLLRAAYRVLEVHPEWQMLFSADSQSLDPGDAMVLKPSDIPEMRALARREGMQALDREPLSRGPWYGLWHGDQLVAQGGTRLLLNESAEIGNIVTAEAHRRHGYGSQVVAALLRELTGQGYTVFLQVLKENEEAVAFYEHLGFARQRTMMLARCRL